jgi:hypothetical protein
MKRRLIAAVLAGTALLATSAAADPAFGRWSKNHTLHCHVGCAPADTGVTVGEGDIVALWQQILWADGFLAKCGSTGIDGNFGPRTYEGTHSWQQYYSSYATQDIISQVHNASHYYVDGIVGGQTWSLAESFLVFTGVNQDDIWTKTFIYPARIDGRSFHVYTWFFGRDSAGQIAFDEFLFEPATLLGQPYTEVDTDHPVVRYPTC